jgi:hypothetical protein
MAFEVNLLLGVGIHGIYLYLGIFCYDWGVVICFKLGLDRFLESGRRGGTVMKMY